MPKERGVIKLKHFGLICDETIDIEKWTELLSEVMEPSCNWVTDKFTIKKRIKKVVLLTNKAREFDPLSSKISEDCQIKVPNSVNSLPFIAVMELISNLSQGTEDPIEEYVADIISLACYTSNNEGKHESSGKNFDKFRDKVFNSPLEDAFGIFNWIKENLTSTQEEWNDRFDSVHIEDVDYDLAGGSRMSQFNVITTLKSICEDFNLPLDEAWHVAYDMVQTNSYAKATQNHIQDSMRIVKEAKMNAKRGA